MMSNVFKQGEDVVLSFDVFKGQDLLNLRSAQQVRAAMKIGGFEVLNFSTADPLPSGWEALELDADFPNRLKIKLESARTKNLRVGAIYMEVSADFEDTNFADDTRTEKAGPFNIGRVEPSNFD